MVNSEPDEKILSIDIGGSRIKAIVLTLSGDVVMDYQKIDTPQPANPQNMLRGIQELLKQFSGYSKVSVGFPGYVRGGTVYSAPNLDNEKWQGVAFAGLLASALNKPVRLLNDADLQGLGVASGKGLEAVITLGTGFGTAFLIDGTLMPHLELAHHPFTKKKTYDEYIGNQALNDIGPERWNNRLRKVIDSLKTVFNYDRLYISGGNSRQINFKLEANITVVSNRDGIKGGAKLWKLPDSFSVTSFYPESQPASIK